MVKADKRKNAAKMLDKNPNDFWKIFNKIVNGDSAKSIKLLEDGKLIDDEKQIVIKMNNFLYEKFEKIHNEIPEAKN